MGGRRKEYAFRFIDSQLYLILHPVEAEWFEEVDILGRGSVEGTIGHPRLLLKSCYRRIQIGTKSLSGVEECPDIGQGEIKTERLPCGFPPAAQQAQRSEEHTSELQSRGHLVCRLLLEKKTITALTRPGALFAVALL